jgi:hypothetical protein
MMANSGGRNRQFERFLMEEHIFMSYKSKLMEGSPEKVDSKMSKKDINVISKIVHKINLCAVFKNIFLLKQMCLL